MFKVKKQKLTTTLWRLLPEIAVAATVLVGLAIVFGELEAFEWLYDFTRDHEDYELDEFIGAIFALPAVLLFIIFRRVRDLQKEIKRRTTAEEEMRHLAQTDPLTSLPNRRHFFKEMNVRLERTSETGDRFALLHLDLDRFKQVNDTLGHAAGDHILQVVSHLLIKNLRRSDLVARIGGDEFLIASVFQKEEEIKGLAERLISVINRPVDYKNVECSVGASIGIAILDTIKIDGPVTPETLLMNADIALYKAKGSGRNCFEVFEPALRTDFEQRTKLSDDILQGLAKREFYAEFQPLIDASSFKVVGVEALARWNHPTRGVLAPIEFIEMAQSMGVIADLDQIIFEEALKMRNKWEETLPEPPRISVNVSSDRLKSDDFIKKITEANVKPGTIIFEISEAVIFEELDDMSRHNLEALEGLGIEIEIDDFGSGRASILSLLEMHPRRLKIDRNLTAPIVSSIPSRRLIRSVIEMADSLGIEVVAEGVETIEHAEILAKQGCTLLQGYYFSRPMTAAAFEDYSKDGTERELLKA
ncbi:MAG: EAL domain-containing protein [Roseibium sp.]